MSDGGTSVSLTADNFASIAPDIPMGDGDEMADVPIDDGDAMADVDIEGQYEMAVQTDGASTDSPGMPRTHAGVTFVDEPTMRVT
ncbi:hypothetical protein SARC_01739 [Sphaeroforma arctica JP610]|uniref:Uncharacterized protein n=1 Tax=Sphaeroforma arctica JP610 TaxID=667725 RepID=A0A0L0GD19_9EUKA|nr:hypothetical protein SARC_01739 [Sphaeroforma arctica JP610]KNC86123.1 hypothetical protein SARC_01739 [Sphaeroforma arctica JP610]|eukprot:XP_014160025.1 hypothetical protein SARC_01739 [Sphaeroforma arctica JP610]